MSLQRDMNIYDEVVHPVKAVVKFNGQSFIIPPAANAGEEPEPVVIPDGAWDLYCGSYERMNGGDMRERADELMRLQSRFGSNRDPVIRLNAMGENENPFGYLEFIRTPVIPSASVIDANMLRAGDIAEV
jgi:hypothetical protein